MHSETIAAREKLLGSLLVEGTLDWASLQAEYLALRRGGFFSGPYQWEGWNDDWHRPVNGKYVSPMHFVLSWLHQLPTLDKAGLVLWGGVGRGKSRLGRLAGIYHVVTYRAQNPHYVSWPEFSGDLRAENAGVDNHAQERYNQLRHADFLILDDLAADRASYYTLVHLYGIINRPGRPMLVLMNRTPQDWLARIVANGSYARTDVPADFADQAERIADRLGTGPGGLCVATVHIESKNERSYRQEAL